MKTISLIDEAKNADYIFISVMGPHANEKSEDIFNRKTNDVNKCGESFWVSGIDERFINICREKLNGKAGYLILVESNGAIDTKNSKTASFYSENNKTWKKIDAQISPVTGKLPNKAYYFNGIELYEELVSPITSNYTINLNFYSEVGKEQKAILFRLGRSNVFAQKNNIKLEGGMKNHERKIVAILRLKYPYIVWVK